MKGKNKTDHKGYMKSVAETIPEKNETKKMKPLVIKRKYLLGVALLAKRYDTYIESNILFQFYSCIVPKFKFYRETFYPF